MFMFLSALPFLGFLKQLSEVLVFVFKNLMSFVGWYLTEFWKGLGIIFQNLSTLTVLLAVLIFGGWYFKSWDNDKVLKQCIKTCPTPVKPERYYHPIKKKVYEKVAPKRIVLREKPSAPEPKQQWRSVDGGS